MAPEEAVHRTLQQQSAGPPFPFNCTQDRVETRFVSRLSRRGPCGSNIWSKRASTPRSIGSSRTARRSMRTNIWSKRASTAPKHLCRLGMQAVDASVHLIEHHNDGHQQTHDGLPELSGRSRHSLLGVRPRSRDVVHAVKTVQNQRTAHLRASPTTADPDDWRGSGFDNPCIAESLTPIMCRYVTGSQIQ